MHQGGNERRRISIRSVRLQGGDFRLDGVNVWPGAASAAVPVVGVAQIAFHHVDDPVRPAALGRRILLHDGVGGLPIARYWYRRAGRARPAVDSIEAEIAALKADASN